VTTHQKRRLKPMNKTKQIGKYFEQRCKMGTIDYEILEKWNFKAVFCKTVPGVGSNILEIYLDVEDEIKVESFTIVMEVKENDTQYVYEPGMYGTSRMHIEEVIKWYVECMKEYETLQSEGQMTNEVLHGFEQFADQAWRRRIERDEDEFVANKIVNLTTDFDNFYVLYIMKWYEYMKDPANANKFSTMDIDHMYTFLTNMQTEFTGMMDDYDIPWGGTIENGSN